VIHPDFQGPKIGWIDPEWLKGKRHTCAPKGQAAQFPGEYYLRIRLRHALTRMPDLRRQQALTCKQPQLLLGQFVDGFQRHRQPLFCQRPLHDGREFLHAAAAIQHT